MRNCDTKNHGDGTISFFLVPLLIFCLFTLLCWSAAVESAAAEMKKTRKIISLSPAITEWLAALGLSGEIAGVTTYCQRPSGIEKKQKVGTIMEIDVEKVAALKPDMVIAMSLTNIKDLNRLEKLGVPVKVFPIPKDFASLCEIFLGIGRFVGKEKDARRLIGNAQRQVSFIKEKTARFKARKVFIQIGAKPLYAATRDYFVNDYIEFIGGINIFKDAATGLVSKEEVLRRNPDVIIIATMGISGENEKKAWQRHAMITAVRNGEVYILDADKICSPTPLTFAVFLREFALIVHPGLQES